MALEDRVEDPVVGRRVRPGAGHPLPVAHVLRDVAVDQQVPEEALPHPPVDQQVLHQERRREHPHPVVHPPGGPQLAHAGVDHREAGAAVGPRLERLGVVAPPQGGVGVLHRALDERRRGEEQVGVPVTPGQLAHQRAPAGRGLADDVGGRAGRERAEPEVGGELRGTDQIGAVALVVVAVGTVGGLGQAGERTDLAGQTRRSLLLVEQRVRHRGGRKRVAGVVEDAGGARFGPRLPGCAGPDPVERGEDLGEPAGRGAHRARRLHEGAPTGAPRHPGGHEGSGGRGVTAGRVRGDVGVGVDRDRASGRRLGRHHGDRITRAHAQPPTDIGQPLVERGDVAEQAGRPTGSGAVEQHRVDDVEGQHPVVVGRGRRPCRVVVEPEVAAEPGDAQVGGHGLTLRTVRATPRVRRPRPGGTDRDPGCDVLNQRVSRWGGRRGARRPR